MEQIEKTSLFDELENDVNIWNLWNDTHKHGNIWMSKDALHYDFILNFLQKFVCNSWIDNFLDGTWSTIEFTLMNYRETTLAYFISKF
jgi:hypothetical protein